MALTLAGCGGSSSVTQTDYVTVNGVYVDDEWRDSDNDSLRMVYVFYTVESPSENLRISSNGLKLNVDGANDYHSTKVTRAGAPFGSYYYDAVIKDVYVGDKLQVLSTFEVPEAELEEGKTLTLESSDIPTIDEIKIPTNDIVSCSSATEIAEKVDPEGYAAEQQKLQPAPEDVTNRVKAAMNGGSWSFWTNGVTYSIRFSAPNDFAVTTMGYTRTGTYEVTNGYVILTYPDTGIKVYVPWSWDKQPIDLALDDGFGDGGTK